MSALGDWLAQQVDTEPSPEEVEALLREWAENPV